MGGCAGVCDYKGHKDRDGGGRRLMEEFTVGPMLGEGAFGVVYSCCNMHTGQQVAVKMVDKVETPIDAIKHEVDMIKGLSHPNIVKFHAVFYEKYFVCIVMDIYCGGDLIDGLQLHLKDRGKISCYSIVHVSSQMGASMQYLHHRSIVHRDVKADNYLTDRQDITSPQCRIALTDFGTAVCIRPGERLKAVVGTKIFWAPEFFREDYGLKVDIWAMGITMYGLLDGHFPFKDENEIKKGKQVKYPRVDPVCENYLRAMLERDEEARISAEKLMAHPWITGAVTGAPQGVHSNRKSTSSNDEDSSNDRRENMLREDVNVGVQARRQELVDRLNVQQEAIANLAASKPDKSDSPDMDLHFWANWFTVADKRSGTTLKFEWWDEERVRKSGLLAMEGMLQLAEDVSGQLDMSPQVVGQMLKDCNVDIAQFGKGNAKTLEQLAAEVQSGSSRLMLDATDYKKIVRVVDTVLLRLYDSDPNCECGKVPKVLVETAEQYPNGHRRETLRMPGGKKQPHETSKEVAQRVLKDFLRIEDHSALYFQAFLDIEAYEEESESPSFPGVATIYRKEIVECYVKDPDADLCASIGLKSSSWGESWQAEESNHQIRYLAWMTEAEAYEKQVKLRAEGSEEVSGLVAAPIGFTEEDLVVQLAANGVDAAKFDGTQGKSLRDFSMETIKGESSLMQGANGALIRVVDSVLLKLVNPKGSEMLVMTEQTLPNDEKITEETMPNLVRRPDENQFHAVKRILRRHLKVDENRVRLNHKNVRYFQEERDEPEYPGIKSVYRKRVISARLRKGQGKNE